MSEEVEVVTIRGPAPMRALCLPEGRPLPSLASQMVAIEAMLAPLKRSGLASNAVVDPQVLRKRMVPALPVTKRFAMPKTRYRKMDPAIADLYIKPSLGRMWIKPPEVNVEELARQSEQARRFAKS